MRSIGLSNTFLVVTPVPDEHASKFVDDALTIRDQVQEVIELIPCVPKLHKLTTLLRERQYDDATEDERDEDEDAVRRATRRVASLVSSPVPLTDVSPSRASRTTTPRPRFRPAMPNSTKG